MRHEEEWGGVMQEGTSTEGRENGQIGSGKDRVWLEWVASLGVQQEGLVPVEKGGWKRERALC